MKSHVKFFSEISLVDAAIVGGKNASLGEMYQRLRSHKIRIPYGFAITVPAYTEFIAYNGCASLINDLVKKVENNPHDLQLLAQVSQELKNKEMKEGIFFIYLK